MLRNRNPNASMLSPALEVIFKTAKNHYGDNENSSFKIYVLNSSATALTWQLHISHLWTHNRHPILILHRPPCVTSAQSQQHLQCVRRPQATCLSIRAADRALHGAVVHEALMLAPKISFYLHINHYTTYHSTTGQGPKFCPIVVGQHWSVRPQCLLPLPFPEQQYRCLTPLRIMTVQYDRLSQQFEGTGVTGPGLKAGFHRTRAQLFYYRTRAQVLPTQGNTGV